MDEFVCGCLLDGPVPLDGVDVKGLVQDPSEKAPFITIILKDQEAV